MCIVCVGGEAWLGRPVVPLLQQANLLQLPPEVRDDARGGMAEAVGAHS